MADTHNKNAEDWRHTELDNWKLNGSKPPRPEPKNQYWNVLDTQEMPYWTVILGEWIDFPEEPVPVPGFMVYTGSPSTAYTTDGRTITVYTATGYPTTTKAGDVLPYQDINYKAVTVPSIFGALLLWEKVS